MPITINGSGTLTGISAGGLPDATIVQADLATGVAGTGPAFSAWNSAATSIANATFTKVAFQSEEFDTNGNFDSTTNYRFTPTVAGYYQVNGAVQLGSVSVSTLISIFKNGATYKRSMLTNASTYGVTVSALVYCNGSTDYIELYAYQASGGAINTNPAQDTTWFQASLVRAA